MTVPALAWLDARRPAPPPALAARLREALLAPGAGGGGVAERCLDAGERLLAGLLARDCAHRSAALDLLAADALVTYAFEAASEAPERMDELARRAMTDLAALAARAEGA